MTAARDFMISYDKQRSGFITMANFLKVLRIFGVSAASNSQVAQVLSSIKQNEIGMVEYERALEQLAC